VPASRPWLNIASRLRSTRVGRSLYAIGGNTDAARAAGIRTDRVLWVVLVLASMLIRALTWLMFLEACFISLLLMLVAGYGIPQFLYRRSSGKWLAPLVPEYISSVDSGNLAGYLLTTRTGLLQLAGEPRIHPRALDGMRDALQLCRQCLAPARLVQSRAQGAEAENTGTEGGAGRDLDLGRIISPEVPAW